MEEFDGLFAQIDL